MNNNNKNTDNKTQRVQVVAVAQAVVNNVIMPMIRLLPSTSI
jgi:hypothetical protein